MALHRSDLPQLVLAVSLNTATSNILGSGMLDDAEAIHLFAPFTLAGICHVQVHTDSTAATIGWGADVGVQNNGWATLMSGGAIVSIAAGECITITAGGYGALRLSSISRETAERRFQVVKQFRV